MNRVNHFFAAIPVLLCAIVFQSCSGPAEAEMPPRFAISVVDDAGIRPAPKADSRDVSSVHYAASFKVYADSAMISVNDTPRLFRRVELSDSTEGWMRNDYMMLDGKPAAAVGRHNELYSSNLTQIDSLPKMIFVAAGPAPIAGYARVTIRKPGSTKVVSGLIHENRLTFDSLETAFAIHYTRAHLQKNVAKHVRKLFYTISGTARGGVFFREVFGPLMDSIRTKSPRNWIMATRLSRAYGADSTKVSVSSFILDPEGNLMDFVLRDHYKGAIPNFRTFVAGRGKITIIFAPSTPHATSQIIVNGAPVFYQDGRAEGKKELKLNIIQDSVVVYSRRITGIKLLLKITHSSNTSPAPRLKLRTPGH